MSCSIIQGDAGSIQTNCQINQSDFNCADFLFKPARWCHKQWKNLTSPFNVNKSKICELLKRIAIFIPLIFATGTAYLIGLFGVIANFCSDNRITVIHSSDNRIIGSGTKAERRVDLSTAVLRAIELHTIGNVVITHTEQEQYVEMTGDDNLLDYLTSRVDGQRLILGLQEGVSINTKNPISYHLHISHMALNRLTVSGSGSIQVDRLETEKLSCRISGQATVNINSGHVTQQNVVISGPGNYNSSNFQSENSHVTISGQGQARVHTNRSLNVKISGMGACIYSGTPQIQQNISGMGRVAHV